MHKRWQRLTVALFATLLMLSAAQTCAANCIADKSPNPQPATSQRVPPVFCLTGAVGQHYYLWAIPDNLLDRAWTVKLESLPGEDTRLLIQSLDHDPHKGFFNFKTLWQGANAAKASSIASPPLPLKPGLYGIVVATRQPPGLFRLSVSNIAATRIAQATPIEGARAPIAPAFAKASSAEPASPSSDTAPAAGGVTDANNSAQSAFAWTPVAPVSGLLAMKNGSRDSQFIALTLNGSWSNKRFDLVLRAKARSESLDLAYVLGDGNDGEIRSGTGEARISRLAFAPGRHVFRISAVPTSDLPYTVGIENVVPVGPGEEHEPNDSAPLANFVPTDGTISGAFDGANDNDYLRFHVSDPPRLWRIQCSCAGADRLAVEGGDGSDLIQVRDFPGGQAQISSLLFAAGDHLIVVRGSSGKYVLHIAPQGPAPQEAGGRPAALNAPLSAIDEIEPNDDPSTAMPLALNSSRGGVNDRPGDIDYYRFTLLGPTHVRLTLTSPGAERDISVGWGSSLGTILRTSLTVAANAPLVWDRTLEAADYYIQVSSAAPSNTPYRVKLETLDPFASTNAHPLALTAQLVLDVSRVAAYAPDGQVVRGHLNLASRAAGPLDLTIAGYAADERWQVAASAGSIHLAPGAKLVVPITIQVAPNAWASHPVEVALGLRDKSGTHSTATAIVSPDISAPEAAPIPAWEVPARLAGGLNVAWSALGAQSLDKHPQLIDGLFNAGGAVGIETSKAKAGMTIALAGSAPAHLVGFVLVPAGSVLVTSRLHRFQILASADGARFTPVFSGAMSPRDTAQYFVLPKPVDARFLKLVPQDAQYPDSAGIWLAEFEAIADPASLPLGQGGLEISPVLRGGHIVQIDPYTDTQAMLSDSATHAASVLWSPSRKEPLSWVVAFLDDHPARIDSIAWRYPPDQAATSAIPSVEVFGSLASPNGPWTKFGDWTISQTGDSSVFRPAGAPPVRYLRFVAAATRQGYGADLPLHLSIHEIGVAKTYHSVLALPVRHPKPAAIALSGSDSGPLGLNKTVHGAVQLGVKSDGWKLNLPDGTQTVTLTLSNSPVLGATLRMKSANGTAVALTEQATAPDLRRYTASIGAGRYEVGVSEPPRSIALLWDTSGSVSGWTPTIIAAVRSIAQDASPGRDEINLFPFHDPTAQPLLKNYTGDPASIFSALQAYGWKDTSSGAEGALIGALETLEHRPGRRGIIMLTDAETSSADMTPQLWQAIRKTDAQIFTLLVSQWSTGELAWKSRNLMTDWAAATGGFTAMIGDQGRTEAAFLQAAAELRDWAPYALTAAVSTTPPPPPAPGTLRVTFAAPKPSTKPVVRDAVALLLDASGSMLQTIKGRKKIDIARSELDHLVRDVVPDGTPMTLRVYGQGGIGSCRSDLMMPLAPLDRSKAEAIVAKVRSTNGAKTATAASLRATADDLAVAQGTKRVILVTDGGENCGGNVEAEIAALKKSGIDVQLDIVGFAIDAPQTGQTFAHWAQLGGGRYFEASDAATLDSAMRTAVKQRFEAVNSKGQVAASGDIGGDPVTLRPGHYIVRLHGDSGDSVATDIEPNSATTAILRH